MREMIAENDQTFAMPVCNNCLNHIEFDKCKAFDKIPDIILIAKDNHSKPFPDQQNNIVFELDKKSLKPVLS